MSDDDFDAPRAGSGPKLLGGLFAAAAFAVFVYPSVGTVVLLVFVIIVTIGWSLLARVDAVGGARPPVLIQRAPSSRVDDAQGVFFGRLEGAARVANKGAGAGVVGRIPGGPRVEVRCPAGRIDLSVELPEGASTSIDVAPTTLSAALGAPRAGGARGTLAYLLQVWCARRVWTEDGRLRLSIPVEHGAIDRAWVDRLFELLRVLLLTLDEVPTLLAGPTPEDAFKPGGPALTLVGRAVAARLESPRVEQQGNDEVVSGRLGEQGVTLRLGPGAATQLSFGIPWRAGFDFDRAGLPADVLARVEQGAASTGLRDPEAALVDLFGALGCVRLHAHARRAHATLRRDQRLAPDAWAELALGIPARLEGLARSPVVIGRRAPDPDAGPAVCPYCRDAADEGATPCASCGTLHHAECFDEAGGCTVLGCAAAPRRGPPVRG